MAIITLTTDMGTNGFYAASVKAAILSEMPTAVIVDITHSIQPFHLSAAAFIIRNAYKHFPVGTVHIVSVDAPHNAKARFIAVQADGYYFIGADNGIFSLALDKQPDRVVEIQTPASAGGETFAAREIMARAAAHLAKGGNIGELGPDFNDYQRPTALQPTYDSNSISLAVLYVDSYGNCICNLSRALFEQVAKGRQMLIDIKGYEIDSISQTYTDKGSGEIVALFSSSGLLELAMNHGDLSQILGLKEGDMIKIQFTG